MLTVLIVWLAGLIAAVCLMVHILWVKKFWAADEHKSLVTLMYSGCFIQLIGVCSFVVYLVLGFTNHQTG